ncbi:MAG: hypothetical protein E6Q24_20125 [Chitinophagaceae bacterium]|nr:MAG: hypothetical protein E6Q24_20125 [Chitinophagaceae bacterium]
MKDAERQILHNSLMNWWFGLTDSWRTVFYYNYLLKTNQELIRGVAWNSKEIVGIDENKTLIGFVNSDLLKRNFSFPVTFVAIKAFNSIELFDISVKYCYEFLLEGSTYKIYWNLAPESSKGIKELTKLKILYLYKQDNDRTKQPRVEVEDFRELLCLKELNLHISHCYLLKDILLLQLPCLEKINFFAGINEISYYQVIKEEDHIRSLSENSRVKLQILGYVD